MGLRTMKRRRMECKTDYKARKILLLSGVRRIVVRQTNKYFILQVVESDEAQDKVVATMTSKELLKNGWDVRKAGSLKSIPAGYLTGLLFAKKLDKGKFIMDLGMARTLKGGRVFAVLAGLVEGGLDIPADSKVFPGEDRLNGEHNDLKDVVESCKNTIFEGSEIGSQKSEGKKKTVKKTSKGVKK
jgi:large subunit ribosomal protein L18